MITYLTVKVRMKTASSKGFDAVGFPTTEKKDASFRCRIQSESSVYDGNKSINPISEIDMGESGCVIEHSLSPQSFWQAVPAMYLL